MLLICPIDGALAPSMRQLSAIPRTRGAASRPPCYAWWQVWRLAWGWPRQMGRCPRHACA